MSIYSKFLALMDGMDRSVDLAHNTLSLGSAQLNGSTSGSFTQNASATTSSYAVVWPAAQGSANTYLRNDGAGNLTWVPASGGVSSVALADGSASPIYSVSGSPITSTGTLTLTLTNQIANTVFAGPASGGSAQPAFRAIVLADLPALPYANNTLSNLSTVALNTDLLPSGPGGQSVGSLSNYFNIFAGLNFSVVDINSGFTTTISSPTLAGNLSLILPPDIGSAGYVLNTDGAGNTSWAPAASSGANTSLSNLSAVAINTALLPGSAGVVSVGSPSLFMLRMYARNYQSFNSSGVLQGQFYGDGLTTPSGATTGLNIVNDTATTINVGILTQSTTTVASGSIYVESGNQQTLGHDSGSINLKTGNNTDNTNVNVTGAVNIVTGNNTGVGGANSGPITLKTGTVVGGTRGKIKLVDGTEGTSGYVWTSTDAFGSGSWMAAGGSGANTALSNLITTSINQDLLPSGDGTRNLGSSSLRWNEAFLIQILDATSNIALDVPNREFHDEAGNLAFQFLSSNRKFYDSTGTNVTLDVNNLTLANSGSSVLTWFGANIRALHPVSLVDTGSSNELKLSVPSLAANIDFIFPADEGSNYSYLSTNGAGATSWKDTLVLGNNKAFTSRNAADTLDIPLIYVDAFNRTNIAALSGQNILINNNVIPAAPDTYSIGVLGDGLLDVFTNTMQFSQSGTTLAAMNFTSNDPVGNGAGTGVTLGTIGISRNLYMFTANGTATKSVWLESGNASAGNSGDIVLAIGSATGTRGTIRFVDGSEGTSGYVWTSTDTLGNGAWMPASGGGANTALSNLITTAVNQDLLAASAFAHNLGNPTTPWGNVAASALLIVGSGPTRKGNILASATTPQGVSSAFAITNQDTQDMAIFSVNRTGISNTSNLFLNTGNTDGSFTSGSIEAITGTTVDANSGDMTLVTGNSTGTGNSGESQLGTGQATGTGISGDVVVYSGDNVGTGNSGALQLNSGNVDSGTSGVVSLASGTANTGSTGGLQLSTGGTSGAGTSGNLGIATGDTLTGATGSIQANTGSIGDSSSANATGNWNILTGSNAGTGFSGDMTLATGSVDGVGSANRSGVIYLFTGAMSDATSTGPTGEMQYGTGNNSGLGDSGDVSIFSGDAATGNSGTIALRTGAAGTNRGDLNIDVRKLIVPATNTTAGTTGAQTINKMSGTVNFASTASSLVVTNDRVTTASIVFAVVRTNDATATIKNVVPAAGSFTINLSAAATAETSVGFWVIN